MHAQRQDSLRNGSAAACVWPTKTSQDSMMSEKLGEIARESSDYRCERCHEVTRIARGMLIPACPHCGYGSYDISNPRFETKDGQLGPHEPG